MKSNKKLAQSLVEYGLILALVAVVAIAALQFLGKKVNEAATEAGSSVVTQTQSAAEAYCTSLDGCVWSNPGGPGVCNCEVAD